MAEQNTHIVSWNEAKKWNLYSTEKSSPRNLVFFFGDVPFSALCFLLCLCARVSVSSSRQFVHIFHVCGCIRSRRKKKRPNIVTMTIWVAPVNQTILYMNRIPHYQGASVNRITSLFSSVSERQCFLICVSLPPEFYFFDYQKKDTWRKLITEIWVFNYA